MDTMWNIPYSLGSDRLVEPSISTHIWNSLLYLEKFADLSEFLRTVLLEGHSRDLLLNFEGVFGVFLGHHLIGDRMALSSSPFFKGGILQGPS
jgi:hypothetical protein